MWADSMVVWELTGMTFGNSAKEITLASTGISDVD